MKKLIGGIILGVIIGVIATELFYSYLADKSEKLNELIQYKYINSHLISNGKPEAIKNQLESWLKYLETYKPNTYSTLATEESVNLERAAAYYRLAKLEEQLDKAKYNTLVASAKAACEKTTEKAKCSNEMLRIISCVTNLYSEKESCKPNKAFKRDAKQHAPLN